jgi:hypothetical protein
MGISLRTLSERISREIHLSENDVEPRYLPNQRDIRNMSQVVLDVLIRRREELSSTGQLKKLEKTQPIFLDALSEIKNNVVEHGYWSFWHYSALTVITCFSYLEALKQGKHKNLSLSDQDNWTDPSLDVAVLSINYITGQLYPDAISKLQRISEQPDVNIETLVQYLLRQIRTVTD